jgi:hypothetical protein
VPPVVLAGQFVGGGEFLHPAEQQGVDVGAHPLGGQRGGDPQRGVVEPVGAEQRDPGPAVAVP